MHICIISIDVCIFLSFSVRELCWDTSLLGFLVRCNFDCDKDLPVGAHPGMGMQGMLEKALSRAQKRGQGLETLVSVCVSSFKIG